MAEQRTARIFLGSIPSNIEEDEIRQTAANFGEVVQFYYMPNKNQEDRGWALITYKDKQEAARAIEALDKRFQFPGSATPVDARFATHKPHGHSNHNNGYQHQPMMQHFANPGQWQQLCAVGGRAYYCHLPTGKTQWERPRELDIPASDLGGHPYGAGGGRGTNLRTGPPGSNLFVFHVPSCWTDKELHQHFQHFGEIISNKIQKNADGKSMGYGFLSFSNPNSAANAIRGMHGFNTGEKFLKVQLRKGEEHLLPPDIQASHGPHRQHFGMGGGGQLQPVRCSPY